jgi:hypothetical protein
MKIATHMPLSLLEPVSAAFPDVEIVSIPVDGEVPEDLEAEILLTLPWGTPNLAAVLEKGIRHRCERIPFRVAGRPHPDVFAGRERDGDFGMGDGGATRCREAAP